MDADGTATGLDEGTATIRVRFRENGKLVYEEASATLHVTRGWKSEYELAIEPERADLLVGSTRKFIVTLTTRRYLDGVLKSTESTVLDNASLSWRSDAPSIASVQSGEATGLKPGTATISATYKIGGKTLSVQSVITVKENNGININSGWDRSGTVILN
ncbi:MAG: Ig-like domain-containing protein [Bacteroidales bacterium]|nr:Ig-like domain-containing protein [Bacteroidales bacterium]